jgi:hypothetical protein
MITARSPRGQAHKARGGTRARRRRSAPRPPETIFDSPCGRATGCWIPLAKRNSPPSLPPLSRRSTPRAVRRRDCRSVCGCASAGRRRRRARSGRGAALSPHRPFLGEQERGGLLGTADISGPALMSRRASPWPAWRACLARSAGHAAAPTRTRSPRSRSWRYPGTRHRHVRVPRRSPRGVWCPRSAELPRGTGLSATSVCWMGAPIACGGGARTAGRIVLR